MTMESRRQFTTDVVSGVKNDHATIHSVLFQDKWNFHDDKDDFTSC